MEKIQEYLHYFNAPIDQYVNIMRSGVPMKNIPSAAVLPAFAPKALPRIRKFLTASVKRRLPPIMSAI